MRFGPKPLLTADVVAKIRRMKADGLTIAEIVRRVHLSCATIYRALGGESSFEVEVAVF